MRALISVSDKTDLVLFAQGLVDRGYTIVSTGGTTKALRQDGGVRVLDVSTITGFPEIMDGRVKTINPRIAGGILARRDNAVHMQQLQEIGGAPIDLVVVNLYPFAKTAADPTKSFDDLIENIDIGGPSLLRAAAKNFRDVLVVVDPTDYPILLGQLTYMGGPTLEFRFELAKKAFAHTSAYDFVISSTLTEFKVEGGAFVRERNETWDE